jgi:hypothetical protein
MRLDTGIPALDRLWGGPWPGGGLLPHVRTGKTPCMMQIARNHGFRIELKKQRPGACGRKIRLSRLRVYGGMVLVPVCGQ